MPSYRSVSLVLRARLALPAAGLGAALLLAPTPARATSAADRATARELATAGIKLYRAGNYKDALDKLTRAEALYDAPVHLLYIARCQVKLGKVVEGAETYRKLGRVNLAANAPAAFKDAQDSGAKELAALEPQIPALHVEVDPANVNDMDVVIDGEHLPAAVVGIDRPADPGKHTIRVTAPGFEAAETTVELKLGEKKPVKLALKPATGGAAPAGPTPEGGTAGGGTTTGGGQAGEGQNKPAATGEKKPSLIGFMAGLRLGGMFSTGDALKDPVSGSTLSMKDFAGPGFGGEIHGGIRIWKYFTPVLFGTAAFLKPKNQRVPGPGGGVLNSTTSGSYQGGGIGVMIGTPRNQFGGFGELDLVFDSVSQTTELNDLQGCKLTTTLSGTAGRIGGGAVIPIGSLVHLTPFVLVTVEKFSHGKADQTGGCVGIPFVPSDRSIPSENQAAHSTFLVGVGGDFIFGSDKPAK